MNIEEILTKLKSEDSIFPRKALKEAIRQQEQITPHLLTILENTNNNIEIYLKRENDYSFIYAMFLLAQFREKLAYPLIIKLVSHPDKILDKLFGDLITEDLGRILASIYGDELKLISEVIENSTLNEYVRSAAVESLIILVASKILSREQVISCLQELFQRKLERTEGYVWTNLVIESLSLCPRELEKDIEQAFEDNLIDTTFIDLDEVKSSLKVSLNRSLVELRKNKHYSLINNTIAEIEWWDGFEKNKPEKKAVIEDVEPTFSALVKKVTASGVSQKKSEKKKKGFGSSKNYE